MSASEQIMRDGTTPEKIDDLVGRWRHNRKLYPGWVIAPPDNRDTLWNYTRNWIEPILSKAKSVSPSRALVWLQELTWRCEMCLIPMWADYAAGVANALSHVRPFPEPPNSESPQSCQTPGNSPDLDWVRLSEAWSALALSLLRFYRETLASAEFEKLADKLLSLSRLNSQLASFVLYQ